MSHHKVRRVREAQVCACGCGTLVTQKPGAGRPRRWADGHRVRGTPAPPAIHRITPLITSRYSIHLSSAATRDLVSTLTLDEFAALVVQPCSYCGHKGLFSGLDRLDSDAGYCADNVVPCCWRCNRMKYTMSAREFTGHIRKIFYHLRKTKSAKISES